MTASDVNHMPHDDDVGKIYDRWRDLVSIVRQEAIIQPRQQAEAIRSWYQAEIEKINASHAEAMTAYKRDQDTLDKCLNKCEMFLSDQKRLSSYAEKMSTEAERHSPLNELTSICDLSVNKEKEQCLLFLERLSQARLDARSFKKKYTEIWPAFVLGGKIFLALFVLTLVLRSFISDNFTEENAYLFLKLSFLIACMPVCLFFMDKNTEKKHFSLVVSAADHFSASVEVLRERKNQLFRDKLAALNTTKLASVENIDNEYTRRVRAVSEKLNKKIAELRRLCDKCWAEAGFLALGWEDPVWKNWQIASSTAEALYFGFLHTREESWKEVFNDVDSVIALPAFTKFGGGRGVLFHVLGPERDAAIGAVQAVIARLLATIPPGKLLLTLVDPVSLGQNVAAFLPLADHEESLVTSRAWSDAQHIERRLAELTEHVENIIQKYLRTEFNSIEEYNERAGEVAEPHRLLVIIDFPVNFTEASARRLVSIVQNGARCGVYTLVVRDASKPLPYGFSDHELRSCMSVIYWDNANSSFLFDDLTLKDFSLGLARCPSSDFLNRITRSVGEAAKGTMKVEVPYAKVLQLSDINPDRSSTWWKEPLTGQDISTAEKIEVPLGPSGARKAQLLTLGKGTAHHALIAGRTGSGKSNLLHVIITTLALKYSPREVELYLIDFKKGVEFKSYANQVLAHARVIAIESEREFGLSVLQGLDDAMQRRGEAFRSVEANDIAEYREKANLQLARIILIVDEFQEFFSEDDGIARQAGMILDRLVRQGRGFGIHIILGSQSLAGSYTLARSTLDQMQIRIALPCSEADSRLILADDNAAARLLSRPGEAIYNASSGMVQGNQLFQVALFSDDDRDKYLKALGHKATNEDGPQRRPVVFEGHEPARVEACSPLNQLLAAADWPEPKKYIEVWLGEPVALLPPTSMRFRKQSGSNLLVVTRDEEEGVGVLMACALGIAAQHRPGSAKIHIVDLSTSDAPWADVPEDLADLFPHEIDVLGRRDVPGLLDDLAADITRRLEDEGTSTKWIRYLIIQGLQRARDLRSESGSRGFSFSDEGERKLSPSECLATILREGPEVGVHSLVWCDTYGNLDRIIEPRVLVEFGCRVVGAMSGDDSTRLLDDAAASRLDRPHRMIKYDEDRVGVLEKFRPYGVPEKDWLETVARAVRGRQSQNEPGREQ